LETQAHHPRGYSSGHALDVEWLCARHHREVHAISPEQREARRVRRNAYFRAYGYEWRRRTGRVPSPAERIVDEMAGGTV